MEYMGSCYYFCFYTVIHFFLHPLFLYFIISTSSSFIRKMIQNASLGLKCHLPLNCQSQQLSSALSSACDFKNHFCKHWTQIRLEQSDQGPHFLPVCQNRFEKFARIFSRRHEQTTFSDAGFLGILRVKQKLKTQVCITWEELEVGSACASMHP